MRRLKAAGGAAVVLVLLLVFLGAGAALVVVLRWPSPIAFVLGTASGVLVLAILRGEGENGSPAQEEVSEDAVEHH